MKNKAAIHTENAPDAIGAYSQAIKVGDTLYLSGQIPLDPTTMALVEGDIAAQIRQVLTNLSQVCDAAGVSLKDIVKLNVYLADMNDFPQVNQVMSEFFTEPYPARAAIGVKDLPKNAQVEIDGIAVI